MAKIRRVDFSPDEWIAGTRELTLEERGAYWDVCALLYSRGGPIANDDGWIGRALGCHVRTWRTIKARLIAVGKLAVDGDGLLTNGRVEREIKRAEGRVKQARVAAEESVKARRERDENAAQSSDYNDIPEASALDFNEANQQPSTSNQQDSSTVSTASLSTDEGAKAPTEPEDDLAFPLALDRSAEATLVASWNAAADIVNGELGHTEWPKVLKLTAERKRKAKVVLRTHSLADVKAALERAMTDRWARGQTTRAAEHASWQFNFDYFLKEKTITRFMEKSDEHPRRDETRPVTSADKYDALHEWGEEVARHGREGTG